MRKETGTKGHKARPLNSAIGHLQLHSCKKLQFFLGHTEPEKLEGGRGRGRGGGERMGEVSTGEGRDEEAETHPPWFQHSYHQCCPIPEAAIYCSSGSQSYCIDLHMHTTVTKSHATLHAYKLHFCK